VWKRYWLGGGSPVGDPMNRKQQRVLLVLIVVALLVTLWLQVVPRLVDCPPGYLYSPTRLRCLEPRV
jgi:hypothetical protein